MTSGRTGDNPSAAGGGRTKRASPWMILVILVVGTLFGSLIPPLQSPDEGNHLKRAYLLAKGKILLDAPDGRTTGGMIDSGLLAYLDAYRGLEAKPGRRLLAAEVNAAESLVWTGAREFSGRAFGHHFPAIYLPQALGLGVGERLGLTVGASCRLARQLAVAAIAVLLFVAFTVFPASPLTIALLVLPMNVFQMSTASLDGVALAVVTLSIALFLRIEADRKEAGGALFAVLALSVFVVATSRAHALPLLGVLLASSVRLGRKRHYVAFGAVAASVALWQVVAIASTVGARMVTGAPVSSLALHYLGHPLAFLGIVARTVSDRSELFFWKDSFVGILGWLDAAFSRRVYDAFLAGTALVALLSVTVGRRRAGWTARLILLGCAAASLLVLLFGLLTSWTPHPASRVVGIQGRHLFIPMILLSYAVAGGARPAEGIRRKGALLVVALLAWLTLASMPRLLVERYYLGAAAAGEGATTMVASPPLGPDTPLRLSLGGRQGQDALPLRGIGILFGTYGRSNPGTAELRLTAADGRATKIPFDLPGLVDNRYRYFALDDAPYAAGEVVPLAGGGVSVWEVHTAEGAVATCLVLEYRGGGRSFTPGCPPY